MTGQGSNNQLRLWLFRQLEPSAWTDGSMSPANRVVVVLILLAAALAVLETEPTVRAMAGNWLPAMEAMLVTVFTLEYAARLYAAGESQRYRGLRDRVRYVFSLWSIIDLMAIIPVILTMGASNTLLLRILKMLRILRVARLGRFSDAWDAMADAMRSRRYELYLSGGIAALLLLISSTLLYLVEAPLQPDHFGSVPRALWWSVATLTTVGYGDVTPITPLGQILAGMTALAGIGLIAMPTGILAAAFSDAIQRRKSKG